MSAAMSGFLTTSAGLGEEGGEGQGYEDPFAANPFRLPTEKEVFQMTKEAKQKKIEERERQKHLSVQDKTTNNRVVSQIQLSRGHLTGGKKSGTAAGKAFKANADQHPRERETVAEFLAKKKEMFLLSLSLDTKWAEIQKLEERALWREEALAKSDKMLLEDSARFERFLRENDQKAIDASRKAEKESRLKQEKVKEIKRLTALIEAMKNELAKVEDHYNKCKGFKKFLDGLTPRDWIIQQRKALGVAEPNGNLDGMLEDGLAMYFTDPRQLLEQFESLEENNLFLIQQSQETEEALEKVKQQFQQTKLKLDAELNMLNMQIEHLKVAIGAEKQKIPKPQVAAPVPTRKPKKGEKVDTTPSVEAVDYAIRETYRALQFDADEAKSADPIQMLTNIEKLLETCMRKMEELPTELLKEAERAKNHEKREIKRAKKLAEQKQEQDVRTQRVLERSTQPVKKRVGKPEMFRSAPPRRRTKKKEVEETEEEEDLSEFFRM